MYAVTVTFTIKEGQMGSFMPLMLQNARLSQAREPECHQFDVCTETDRPNEVFLYELYSNADAFQDHLKSAHFRSFDAEVTDMIATKQVCLYAQVVQ
ncbi:MAG: putative quinol monooxygenase [Litoreibacter sp.]|nr:putative quinol monooxygenase [Litoreibacter sp.]